MTINGVLRDAALLDANAQRVVNGDSFIVEKLICCAPYMCRFEAHSNVYAPESSEHRGPRKRL